MAPGDGDHRLSHALALLGALAATLILMAGLIAAPALAVVLCAALPLVGLACAYVCGDERGFTSGTRLDWLLQEYDRMKRAAAAPPARADWQDDGM